MKKYKLIGKKVREVENISEWAKWFETADRVVKQETLPNGFYVSTVFLALDHSFGPSRKPSLFETMVFPRKGVYSEMDVERYATWKEAEAGHKRMVKKWAKKPSKSIAN